MMSIILYKLGFDVVCTDLNEKVLDIAKQNANSFNAEIDFVKVDMFDISSRFKYKEFDIVYSQGVLEHFEDEDIIKAIRAQNDIAKYVLIDVPSYFARNYPNLVGDERLMTFWAWKRIIKKTGLTIRYSYGRIDDKKWYIIKKIIPCGIADFLNKYFCQNYGFLCSEKD